MAGGVQIPRFRFPSPLLNPGKKKKKSFSFFFFLIYIPPPPPPRGFRGEEMGEEFNERESPPPFFVWNWEKKRISPWGTKTFHGTRRGSLVPFPSHAPKILFLTPGTEGGSKGSQEKKRKKGAWALLLERGVMDWKSSGFWGGGRGGRGFCVDPREKFMSGGK